MKRVLFDPVSIGLTVASSVISGLGAMQQGKAESRYLKDQANQEALARQRDLDALHEERDRSMARARALLSAQGGSTTEGTAADVLAYTAGTFGENEMQLIHDSDARIRSLSDRARAAKSAGQTAMFASIFGGLAKAGASGGSGGISGIGRGLSSTYDWLFGSRSPYGGRLAPRPD